jgi:putative intracellular protease/amidase
VLVAIPLFERFTALDAVGPYEVLQRVPSIDVAFVGHQRGEVRSDNGMLGMTVDKPFAELTQPDVVVFPGGIGTRVLINDVYHVGVHRRPGVGGGRSA